MIPRGRGGGQAGARGRGAMIAESDLHGELNKQVEEKKWQKLE